MGYVWSSLRSLSCKTKYSKSKFDKQYELHVYTQLREAHSYLQQISLHTFKEKYRIFYLFIFLIEARETYECQAVILKTYNWMFASLPSSTVLKGRKT